MRLDTPMRIARKGLGGLIGDLRRWKQVIDGRRRAPCPVLSALSTPLSEMGWDGENRASSMTDKLGKDGPRRMIRER